MARAQKILSVTKTKAYQTTALILSFIVLTSTALGFFVGLIGHYAANHSVVVMQAISCSASVACPKGRCSADGSSYAKYACINSQCLELPYLLNVCPNDSSEVGLKGYWKFDEGSGNKTKNKVNNYWGQIWLNNQSSTTWTKPSLPWVYGVKDFTKSTGLSFSGSKSYANLGSITDVGGGQITVSFWLKLLKPPSKMVDLLKQPVKYPTVLYKDGVYNIYFATEAGWGAGTSYKDKLIVKYFDASGVAHDAFNVSSQALELNTWHYIAWVFDGKTSTLYVDGKVDSQKAVTQPIMSKAGNLYVSSMSNTLDGGRIDELKVYWRALPRAEIFQQIPSGEAISFGDYESPLDNSYCGDEPNEYVTTAGTGGPKCCAFKKSILQSGACVQNDGRSDWKYLQVDLSLNSDKLMIINSITTQNFYIVTSQFKDSADEVSGQYTAVISNDSANKVYGAWRFSLAGLYTLVDPVDSCFDAQGNFNSVMCGINVSETINLPCYAGATTLRILDSDGKEFHTKDITGKCD